MKSKERKKKIDFALEFDKPFEKREMKLRDDESFKKKKKAF